MAVILSRLSEEPLRADQKDKDGHREDDKSAAFRKIELPGKIDNAENESGEECTTNITEAADSNHDEKDHQIFKGEDRLDAAKDLDAKAVFAIYSFKS